MKIYKNDMLAMSYDGWELLINKNTKFAVTKKYTN